MTGDPTLSDESPPDPTADDRIVCPVCGVEGSGAGDGLRNHLVYEHGWDEKRVPAAPSIPTERRPTD